MLRWAWGEQSGRLHREPVRRRLGGRHSCRHLVCLETALASDCRKRRGSRPARMAGRADV